MATHLLSVSTRLQTSIRLALRTSSQRPKKHIKEHSFILGITRRAFQNSLSTISSAANMTAGQYDEPRKINLETLMDKAKNVWDSAPRPANSFPWNRALENFILIIIDQILAVIKYLSVPLLSVSSLSEMSYCAQERRLVIVPVPLVIGFTVAGILKETTLSLSPLLKDAEVPWHLITIAIFFTLLKLPGPYYPYWGRIFIPHFANGGLLRTIWLLILWSRRPQMGSKSNRQMQ